MNLDNISIKEFLEPWFSYKEHDILDEFAGLSKKSLIIGDGDYRSVFVPGTRDDRVLLVAHVDTVVNDSPHVKVGYENGMFFSLNRGRGLNKKGFPYSGGMPFGADDRAGCALLYLMKDMGHSLLLTNSEESGCLSSMYLASNKEYIDMMQEHSFAIQFDRAGRNDLVFYDVGSEEFENYCVKNTGYSPADGSFTDIRVLCEKICGVNISVGYKNEHTGNEVLNTRWWERTARTVHKWLSKDSIKKFRH